MSTWFFDAALFGPGTVLAAFVWGRVLGRRDSQAFGPPVTIDYTNHRGERALRSIRPIRLRWGSTAYHPQAQWLLEAWDEDKRVERTFALADIHSWSRGRR